MIRIARFLLSNLFTLLLSFLLALLIWVNASQTSDPIQDRWLQIPLEYVGQPENSILLSAERQNVQIFFEGTASIVNQMSTNDFSAIVDLSQVPFGQEMSVDVQVRTTTSNVTFLLTPEPVPVQLEELVTREIPVELDIRGDIARGHVQGDPLIDPEVIAVSGPASRVETLDRARATIFLNDERETIVESSQPIFYDRQNRVASVSGLTLSTDQVEITVPINEAENYAEKFITIDLVGQPAPGYRLLSARTDPPSVLVQGPPTQLASLTQLRTEPVDITGLTESFRQQVTLALPSEVALDEVVEIFVDVEIEPFLTTRPYNQLVILQGLAEDLEATVEPETVRIVLFGPLPVLETLLDEEVRATVDLFELEPGVYSLEPDVDFPDRGIELRSVQPSLVTVSISHIITPSLELTPTLELTSTLELTQTVPVTETSSTMLPVGLTFSGADLSMTQVAFYAPDNHPIHLPRRLFS